MTDQSPAATDIAGPILTAAQKSAVDRAEEKIEAALWMLEEATGLLVGQVNIDTRNRSRLKTEISLTKRQRRMQMDERTLRGAATP